VICARDPECKPRRNGGREAFSHGNDSVCEFLDSSSARRSARTVEQQIITIDMPGFYYRPSTTRIETNCVCRFRSMAIPRPQTKSRFGLYQAGNEQPSRLVTKGPWRDFIRTLSQRLKSLAHQHQAAGTQAALPICSSIALRSGSGSRVCRRASASIASHAKLLGAEGSTNQSVTFCRKLGLGLTRHDKPMGIEAAQSGQS